MNPFLEAPNRWQSFHSMFLGTLQQQLSALLPPGFVSRPEQRVYIVPEERDTRPEVVAPAPASASNRQDRPPPTGRTSGAPRQTPPERAPRPAGQVVEKFIEIRDVRSSAKNVVAIIELLNPATKETSSIERAEYRKKQNAVLTGAMHLIEIDLLRGGEHTVYVPENVLRSRGAFDYVVTLSDASQPTEYLFWRVSLREPLPVIDIPLAEGIIGIKLDLQTVFDTCWEANRLDADIDSTIALTPPLSAEDAPWVAKQVSGVSLSPSSPENSVQ